MKRETKVLLNRAAKLAHLIGTTIETNEHFGSAEFLDLDVAVADLQKLISDAHNSEYSL